MKISTRQDIDLPIDTVFAAISDFDAHELSLLRRGIKLERLAPSRDNLPTWRAEVVYRRKKREVTAEAVLVEPPSAMEVDLHHQGVDMRLRVELVDLARTRTRMIVGILLTPRTIGARLVIQSLKLAKGTIERRLNARLSAYVRELQSGHQG